MGVSFRLIPETKYSVRYLVSSSSLSVSITRKPFMPSLVSANVCGGNTVFIALPLEVLVLQVEIDSARFSLLISYSARYLKSYTVLFFAFKKISFGNFTNRLVPEHLCKWFLSP